MPDSEDGTQPETMRPFLVLIAVVLLGLASYAVVLIYSIGNWQERGQFGDMFGAANTLFSGLAFSALAYALFLQRRELSLQRKELSLTREELAKQSNAQIQQSETALRAAEISALGALFQGYTQLMQSGQHSLIHPQYWPDEVLSTKKELWKRLGRRDA